MTMLKAIGASKRFQGARKPSCNKSRFAKPAPLGSFKTSPNHLSMPSVAQKFIASGPKWEKELERRSEKIERSLH